MRGQRDGGRGVASDWLEQDGRGRKLHLAQLFGHEEAMRFVANNNGTGGIGESREPRGGLLDHGALAGERQQLLGQELARQRPEPRAGAAGEDHGDEFHGRHRTPPRSARLKLAATDGVVREAQLLHHGRVVEIAAVEDHRRLELLLEVVEVRAAEFLPLRDDRQRIGAFERLARTRCTSVRSGRSPKMRRVSFMAAGSKARTFAPAVPQLLQQHARTALRACRRCPA